jgi:hypothetical protein
MRRSICLCMVLGMVFTLGCGYIKREPVPLEQVMPEPEHTPLWEYDGWIIARGSVHNHTTFSDGCRVPEDLVKQARNEGIAVLSITDHREGKICGGKFCVDVGGIDSKKCGYSKYLDHMKRLAAESEMPIILIGMEVAPYAWNERDVPWFLIRGSGWHFTTYGIYDPEVYERMPARDSFELNSEDRAGLGPYEEFVNYIRDAGGMVFHAHPESSENRWVGPAHFWARAPYHLTARLPRLTGVALIPRGISIVGNPGGEWDQALIQYLAGLREEPLWGWGEADFHCVPGNLRIGTTLFYLREFSREDVFQAVHEGRMIALMGDLFQESYVAEFSISHGKEAHGKVMLGQEVKVDGPCWIRFSLNNDVPLKHARLIRNGKVIYQAASSSFEYKDREGFEAGIPCYYRVELIGEDIQGSRPNRLFTNPVFVRIK